MRIPLGLMMITVLVLFLAALTVHGNAKETTGAPLEVGPTVEGDAPLRDIQIMSGDTIKDIDLGNLWGKSTMSDPLVWRFTIGILRSRVLKGTKNKIYWERCGKKTPEGELISEAQIWAEEIIRSFDRVEEETGVSLNRWGAFATMANEGGFNECSLNYAARLWAARHEGRELITETWKGRTVKRKVTKFVVEKFRQSYDRDTVWRILHHKDYATAKVQVVGRDGKEKTVRLKNKFDGGVWQLRHSVKKLSRKRFDDLTSLVPGVYLGAKEMARRAIWHKKVFRESRVHPRPWMLWPGLRISLERKHWYDRKISSVARWLGATRAEI